MVFGSYLTVEKPFSRLSTTLTVFFDASDIEGNCVGLLSVKGLLLVFVMICCATLIKESFILEEGVGEEDP
jgi:hypothetical protein